MREQPEMNEGRKRTGRFLEPLVVAEQAGDEGPNGVDLAHLLAVADELGEAGNGPERWGSRFSSVLHVVEDEFLRGVRSKELDIRGPCSVHKRMVKHRDRGNEDLLHWKPIRRNS